jgi:diguanylate cyclase (GGDEF)-like protein
LLLDIDNFKKYPDTYGHPAGDTVAGKRGELIGANLQSADSGYPQGGAEVKMVFPRSEAKHLAGKQRPFAALGVTTR